jgi:transposase
MPQPPYSPDLAPADFFLFPTLKSTLKGRWFESTEDREENLLTELRAIKKKIIPGLFPKLEKKKNAGSVVLRMEGSTLKVTRPTSF